MDALALTDRDGCYGAVKFATACAAAGHRPAARASTSRSSRPACCTGCLRGPTPRGQGPPRTRGRGRRRVGCRGPPQPGPRRCPGRPPPPPGHGPGAGGRPGDRPAGRRRVGPGVPAGERRPRPQHPRAARGDRGPRWPRTPWTPPACQVWSTGTGGTAPAPRPWRCCSARSPRSAGPCWPAATTWRWPCCGAGQHRLPAGSLFVELVHHRSRRDTPGSVGLAGRMLAVADAAGVPDGADQRRAPRRPRPGPGRRRARRRPPAGRPRPPPPGPDHVRRAPRRRPTTWPDGPARSPTSPPPCPAAETGRGAAATAVPPARDHRRARPTAAASTPPPTCPSARSTCPRPRCSATPPPPTCRPCWPPAAARAWTGSTAAAPSAHPSARSDPRRSRPACTTSSPSSTSSASPGTSSPSPRCAT